MGDRIDLSERDQGGGPSLDTLKPDHTVGVAIGIVVILSLLLFFCCYLKCGVCCLASRAVRRRTGGALQNSGQFWSHKDPEMQRHSSEAQIHRRKHMGNDAHPRTSSTASPPQLYVDRKIELPVPSSMRHEIDGVGRSAASAPNKVEIDGTPLGPFELPSEPAAPRQSWRTTSTTIFHYTPRPSYIVSEEGGEVSNGNDLDTMSPKTPTNHQRLENRVANRSSGEISPLTLAAPRRVASLGGVVEAQYDERDTTKGVLSPQE